MRRIRQLRSALLGAVVLVAVLLGAAGPASAHDTAESTSPASGATLAAPPEQVSVTFNHNPLALGSQILVNDAAGANWSDGAGGDRGQRRCAEAEVRRPGQGSTPCTGGWPVPIATRSRAASPSPPRRLRRARRRLPRSPRWAPPSRAPRRRPPLRRPRRAVPVERHDLRRGGRRHPGGPGPDGQDAASPRTPAATPKADHALNGLTARAGFRLGRGGQGKAARQQRRGRRPGRPWRRSPAPPPWPGAGLPWASA